MSPPGAQRLYRSAPVFLVAMWRKRPNTRVEIRLRDPGFWGEPPGFSIVRRDGVTVMLSQAPATEDVRPNGDCNGRLGAYVYVADADAYHAELVARRAGVICAPEDQPYGGRAFMARDLDGHVIAFGQDLLP